MYISVYVKYKLYTPHQNMHHICLRYLKYLKVKKSLVHFVLQVVMFLEKYRWSDLCLKV